MKNEKDILNLARTRLNMAISAYSDSRGDELDDLRFYAGNPDNKWQWPSDVLQTRGAINGQSLNSRPCLTINKLPQHVKQITNEQRQNRPTIKVIPANDSADAKMAEVFNGLIRHIEYISDADVAYDTACENQVSHGEGFIRILTDYCDEKSFNQDIKILRVRNSFSVYIDPLIQDPTGADAQWCFIVEDIPKKEYEARFPNASPASSIEINGVGDASITQWINEETIRIAEYFYFEETEKTLNLFENGESCFSDEPKNKQLVAQFRNPIKTRSVNSRKVKHLTINGYEVLAEAEWAGAFIPVIRVVGNEFEVEGRYFVSGIVRNAKDAQRMYNYWASQEAEMLALAPKAPFIGYGGQFEGYENKWATANVNNWPYLEVNPDVTDGQGGVLPLPQRAQPPMASSGLLQAKSGASEDIKSTTGQYNASLGLGGNERSGRAILARQRESDTGTYHYVDNLARAVRHVGRQLVDLIPKIYDTNRIARIIGEDGESETVKLNPMQPMAVNELRDYNGNVIERIFNPNVGKYDVFVSTGPGWATKRQEALENMAQLLQGNPQLWAAAGDLFVKNMDWPGALELSERLKKTLDPKLLSEENPEISAAKQQIQEMEQQMMQMQQMLQNVQNSIEMRDIAIKEYNAETNRIKATQSGMTPEQIQDIAMGTVDAALHHQLNPQGAQIENQ